MFIPLIKDQTTAKILKTDFSGGMNRRGAPIKVDETQYPLLRNGRTRYGNVAPIQQPLELTGQIPAGNLQGHYAFGNLHVAFVSGAAYVRDYTSGSLSYNRISGFLMSPIVDVIYAQLVPATGVITTIRKAVSSGQAPESILKTLRSSAVDGAPQCLLCQDGINRPWLIFADGATRIVQDINEWQIGPDVNGEDTQEYVPIGRQMVLAGGILYIVSPDGTELYRSVSGRPLDFVIAVDQNGNKLTDNIIIEASRLSYKVAIEEIVCVGETNTNDGSFYVSTAKNSYLLTPDFSRLVYGEPARFNRASIGDSGALNQFSFLGDILGDSAFIDQTGIRSFNSIYQTKFRGENAPMSANIFRLFEGVVQDSGNLAVAFVDNYAFFACNTIYGYVVLVYDTLTKQYVSYDKSDLFTENQAIKQFSVLNVNNRYRLFFSTSDNKLYEAYAGTSTETCELYIGDWALIQEDRAVQILPNSARIVLVNTQSDGTLYLTDYVDGQAGITQTQEITAHANSESLQTRPLSFPFGSATGNFTDNVIFDLQGTNHGWMMGLHIKFNFSTELSYVDISVTADSGMVSSKQKLGNYRKFRTTQAV